MSIPFFIIFLLHLIFIFHGLVHAVEIHKYYLFYTVLTLAEQTYGTKKYALNRRIQKSGLSIIMNCK
jgi:hypothetical protein